jgi:ABC-2 type transport system permease protein
VLLQALYLQRLSLAVWSLALVLLVAMYVAIWPSLRDQPVITR